MAEVQGTLVNMWVRVSGTANAFKKLICLENSNFQITNEVTERRTNCGVKTGVASPTFNASGSAVQDPLTDGTSVSYADVKAWQVAKTKLDFNYKNDADSANGLDVGEGIQNYGSGFFTERY